MGVVGDTLQTRHMRAGFPAIAALVWTGCSGCVQTHDSSTTPTSAAAPAPSSKQPEAHSSTAPSPWTSPVAIDCAVQQQLERNTDDSSLELTVHWCPIPRREANGKAALTAELVHAAPSGAPRLLPFIWEPAEDRSGARLIDVDADGDFELELSGTCGSGPNCERAVWRLHPQTRELFQWFESSGYATLEVIDEYVVEGGRNGCCAWEYRLYSATRRTRIDTSHPLFAVTVQLSDGANGETRCLVRRHVGPPGSPAMNTAIALCERHDVRTPPVDVTDVDTAR